MNTEFTLPSPNADREANTSVVPSAGEVVVIGAGMAGLQCATSLAAKGLAVTVLDKGSRPGGRMATRPLDGHYADYGAQYMESRSNEFRMQLREWQEEGLARLWGFGFEGEDQPSGLARYLVEGGINQLPAHMAASMDLRVRAEVESVALAGEQWELRIKDAVSVRTSALVITCPVPQTINLLRKGGVEMDRPLAKRLDTVIYEPCFTLLAKLSGESGLPCPGALALDGNPIAWMADNRQKGLSKEATVVTIHAGPEFSSSHFDDDKDRVIRLMEQAAADRLASPVVSRHLHRWRYARPRTPLTERFLVLQEHPLLVLAGDAFGGRDVEAAALSGMAAAGAVFAGLKEGSFVGN